MSRKALIIGIDKYPSGPLHKCVSDSEELADLLKFNGDQSANFDVKLMTDCDDVQRVKAAIIDLFHGDDDVALLYYSGHGSSDEIGGSIVIPDPTSHRSQALIRFQTIMEYVNRSKVKNKILVFDSCFSGHLGNYQDEEFSHIKRGTTIFTACRENEEANEDFNGGVFSSLFIDALYGGAADFNGHITVGSIYAYIDKALGAWCQRPLFRTNVSEFVPLRNVKPQVALEDILQIKNIFKFGPDVSYPLDPSYECTNTPGHPDCAQLTEPYAVPWHVQIFKTLQKLVSIGFVEPVGEEHMYYAAMHSKSCRLTALGEFYWKLANEGRLK